MPRPTSFRLPAELLERLDEESRARGISVTSLLTVVVDEGLKTLRFPGIVYREGPTGRRAGLLGGPDVWEIVRDLRRSPGKGLKRIEHLASATGIAPGQIRLAAEFYAAFPDEIDARIAMDERAADRVRSLIKRREELLSS